MVVKFCHSNATLLEFCTTRTTRTTRTTKQDGPQLTQLPIGTVLVAMVAAIRHGYVRQDLTHTKVLDLFAEQTTVITGGANTIFLYVPPSQCRPPRRRGGRHDDGRVFARLHSRGHAHVVSGPRA